MRILVLNGPNLNMLGLREPSVYGHRSYAELERFILDSAKALEIEAEVRQSNHEGVLIDWIQGALGAFDAIAFNPGGYTHSSVALLDALLCVGLPTVEVHLSDVDAREDFRKRSFIRQACVKTICGKGFEGYREALAILKNNIN